MRKLLITLAVAGSALAVAAPASAQFYPQQQPGYGRGYGYGQSYLVWITPASRLEGDPNVIDPVCGMSVVERLAREVDVVRGDLVAQQRILHAVEFVAAQARDHAARHWHMDVPTRLRQQPRRPARPSMSRRASSSRRGT